MKTATFANDLLKLIFQGTAIADIAENDSSGPLTSFYLSLHTANPAAGDQTTSEVAYTGYARQGILRSASGFTVSGNIVVPVDVISFPVVADGTGQTAKYFGIGTLVSGTGKLLYADVLSPSIALDDDVIPRIDLNPPASGFGTGWSG